jgi:hypothetical protein
MQRRRLLTLGLGAAALLATVGGGLAWLRPGVAQGHLTAGGAAVFRAVALAVLEGSLPALPAQRELALSAHMHRLNAAIAAFPAATQAELSQLLALLASPPGRRLLAGLHTDWDEASVPDIQQSMQSMRLAALRLRQQAYHALRDLTNAAFYAAPATWPAMGYPGPVPV